MIQGFMTAANFESDAEMMGSGMFSHVRHRLNLEMELTGNGDARSLMSATGKGVVVLTQEEYEDLLTLGSEDG